jgi:exopolysaccharide biosynthesis protein
MLGTPPERWQVAIDAVGGAGLLMSDGHALDAWDDEQLQEGFTAERHPRTMIGTDDGGDIWLATIDGRRLDHSVGMTFAELQRLAYRLRLRDALNLDGGGSTTMVVRGRVVNQPSDSEGPRPVSDALLVLTRRR